MIHEAEGARRRNELTEEFLSRFEGKRPQVVPHDAQEIEGVERRWLSQRRSLYVHRPADSSPFLEALKARSPGLVVHDDLAVDHKIVHRECPQRPHDLRKPGRGVVSVSRVKAAYVAMSTGDHPVSIEFEFEQPLGIGKRRLGRMRQHDLHALALHSASGSAQVFRLFRQGLTPVHSFAKLFDGQSAENRLLRDRGIRFRCFGELSPGEGALFTNQQPLILGLLQLHQSPHPTQLVASKLEQELSFRHSGLWVFEGDPVSPVPDDHRARPVITGRDHILEIDVLQWVVLDVHGESLFSRVEGRALRNGPRGQGAAPLEAQVPMKPAGRVFVDDEQSTCDAAGCRTGAVCGRSGDARFRGRSRGSFVPVWDEGIAFRHGFTLF